MKRSVLTLLFVAAAFSFAAAQSPINVGIKAGANFSNINLDGEGVTDEDFKSQVGLVAGGFVRINLGKLSIQPEVLYSQKKFKKEADGFTDEYTLNEVDVPVLLGIKLVDAAVVKLRLVAGPMFSFNVDSKVDASDGSEFSEDIWEDAKIGYAAGLSLDVTKITIDVRYNGQFSDTFDSSQFGVDDFESSTGWFQVTVGFKFI